VVLDLLSLTEEAAMWQKNAFAKRQVQEDFGFAEAHSNEERRSNRCNQELLKVGR
jgi:hypothetical protein